MNCRFNAPFKMALRQSTCLRCRGLRRLWGVTSIACGINSSTKTGIPIACGTNSSTKTGIPIACGMNSSTKVGIPIACGSNSLTNITAAQNQIASGDVEVRPPSYFVWCSEWSAASLPFIVFRAVMWLLGASLSHCLVYSV